MSISDAIAPHIPLLRRFARALCGTQAAGDAYVAATLEAILADPDCFDAKLDPKVAMYKLFLRGWRNVPSTLMSISRPSAMRAARAGISPRFLLSRASRFS